MVAHRTAKKQIQSFFYSNWKDGIDNGLPTSDPPLAAINFVNKGISYTPKVYWRNIEKRGSIPQDEHFAVMNLEDLVTSQRSLPGGRVQGCGVKFSTPGVGVVQLFFSKNNYSTAEEDLLSAIVQEMFFCSQTNNVWFRNPTIKTLAPEESFFRTNVTFEYEFDTHIIKS